MLTMCFSEVELLHRSAAAALHRNAAQHHAKNQSSATQKCGPAPRKNVAQRRAKMRPSTVQKLNGSTKRKWSSGTTALCGSGAILEH